MSTGEGAARSGRNAGSADAVDVATGATGVMAARLLGRALDLVTELVLARLLGPAGYGLYALGWTILQLCGPMGDLGLTQGVIQFATRAAAQDPLRLKGILVRSLALAPISGLAVGAALWLGAPMLAVTLLREPGAVPVLRACAPVVPLVAWLRVAAAATRASLRMRYSAISQDLVQSLAQLVFVLLLAAGSRKLAPEGAVAAYGASMGLGLALALWFVRRIFRAALALPGMPGPVMGEMLRFSLPTVVAEILARLNGRIERFVIAFFATTADVGVFQAASQPAMVLTVLLGAFTTSLGPRVAALHGLKDTRRLDEIFKVSTKWGLLASLPLFLVLAMAPGEIMALAFGPGYEGGSVVLVILACSQLANVASGSVGVILVQTGHQRRWLAVSAGSLVIDVALGALLVPRIGVAGAALAAVVTNVARFSACLYEARRLVGVWPYDGRYLKPAAAALAATGAALLVRFVAPPAPALMLASVTVAVGAAFAGTLVALGLQAEDRAFLRRLLSFIKR